MSSSKHALELQDFAKSFRSHWTYREIKAVQPFSLQITQGESFGFLGHNGAGKTTTIKAILGLITPTAGKILFEGRPFVPTRDLANIGYLPEHPYFYDHLSVYETLQFFCCLHTIAKAKRQPLILETLELVGLLARANQRVRTLSKGLQQRLALAGAIINKPRLLFLDEPFSGLDPLGRVEIRTILRDLHSQGTTLFISSHILSDIEDLCTRVSIMKKGELKTVLRLADITKMFGTRYELTTLIENDNQASLARELQQSADAAAISDSPSGVLGRYEFASYESAHRALTRASQAGATIRRFQSRAPSLEEVFVDIISEEQQ